MTGETTGEHIGVDGVRLHVVSAGGDDARPVVLLHGFPEFWYGWRGQIEALAGAGHRVLVPDQRGYNLSDKPRRVRAYGLDTLIADVVGLLDAAGIARALLVGHDWGGAVAWWTAVRHPERVERLAVLNCPHPLALRRALREDAGQRRKSWYIFFFQLPWLPEAWYRKKDFEIGARSLRGSSRRGTFSDEDLARYKEAWGRPGALRGMIHWYRAALRHPPRRAASARVTVPALVLWGDRDRFLSPGLADRSLAYCDHGRLQRYPEASHWIQHEESGRVTRDLLEFFA